MVAPHESTITRQQLVRLLNEELAREYQAIIAYVTDSQAEGLNHARRLGPVRGGRAAHDSRVDTPPDPGGTATQFRKKEQA